MSCQNLGISGLATADPKKFSDNALARVTLDLYSSISTLGSQHSLSRFRASVFNAEVRMSHWIGIGKNFVNIYCGNISYRFTEDDLRELFGAHGTVSDANVIIDRDTGRSKGFGFVEMPSDDEANAAIQAIDGQEHGGRQLRVNEARPREPRR